MGVVCTDMKMSCKHKHKVLLVLISSLCCVAWCEDEGESFFGQTSDTCSGENCLGKEDIQMIQPPYGRDSDSIEKQIAHDDKVSEGEINVIMTFTNADRNINLQNKFTVTVSSILHYTSVPLVIYIIGDEISQQIAASIIKNNAGEAKYRMVNLDVDKLARDLDDIVKPMQEHFSYKPGSYYNHALFFLSMAIHRVMPESIHKVIMLDADLKFTDDIRKLHDRFRLFRKDNVIGIGREMQPVYKHAFSEYRRNNPGTRVGQPGPDGLTGFNSGVLLLNIDAMRKSKLYNSLLTAEAVERLTTEFHFKGHLGDQDLFTLINMKYEWLFHVLPCNWNRQLCTWWRDHGYKDVFDQYYNCEGDIKIWHGNCNTPIP